MCRRSVFLAFLAASSATRGHLSVRHLFPGTPRKSLPEGADHIRDSRHAAYSFAVSPLRDRQGKRQLPSFLDQTSRECSPHTVLRHAAK